MKKSIILMLMVAVGGRLFPDPITITVQPRHLITFLEINRDMLANRDDPGFATVRPIFDGSKGISFFMNDGTVWRYSYSLKGHRTIPFPNKEGFGFVGPRVSNDYATLFGGSAIAFFRVGETYRVLIKKIPFEVPLFVALIDDFVLYCDYRAKTMTYYSVTLKNDWTFVERNQEETMKLAESGKYGLLVKDGTIYYKGLELRGVVEQFDDDGNQYNGQIVRIESHKFYDLYIPDDFRNVPVFFDPEGNLYVLDYTRDKEKHPMLYYAGRDWGYREAPRSAVTTEGGLRIRLRANTDAFIIGTMGDQEPITILKTGKSETLGGLTAPWYRIKTADGTIGWAFGGYIRVTE